MRKGLALFSSVIFLVLVPGTVAGVVPWAMTRWMVASPDWPQLKLLPMAAVLIGAGLFVLLDSFARFALQGRGTPAPVFPTTQLIVTGLYRYVRNPMYVAVLSIIIGQATFFGSLALMIYAGTIWAMFHLFVVLYEEPRLREDYGGAYHTYCKYVPRWLPRVSPWRGT